MSFQLQFTLPKANGNIQDHQTLGNLVGHSDTLAISQASQQFNGLTVVVTPDTRTALRLEKSLAQFSGLPVQLFPDWETLPYDNFSPHQDIIRLVYLLYSSLSTALRIFGVKTSEYFRNIIE